MIPLCLRYMNLNLYFNIKGSIKDTKKTYLSIFDTRFNTIIDTINE